MNLVSRRMSRTFFSRVGVAAAVTCSLTVACSDPVQAPTQGILTATLSGTATNCGIVNSQWLTVGNFAGGDKAKREAIQTSQLFEGRVATVECVVSPNGADFNVDGRFSLAGEGSVRITGSAFKPRTGAENVTTTGVHAIFTRNDTNAPFDGANCTVDYVNASDPADLGNSQRNVAPGRVWGLLTCDKAISKGDSKDQTCTAKVEFLMENCNTQ